MDGPRGAYPTKIGGSIPAGRTRPEDRDGSSGHFSAPLGSSENGRLRLTKGAHRITIRANPHLRGLYRARFGNRTPTVAVREDAVTVSRSAVRWLKRANRSARSVAWHGRVVRKERER